MTLLNLWYPYGLQVGCCKCVEVYFCHNADDVIGFMACLNLVRRRGGGAVTQIVTPIKNGFVAQMLLKVRMRASADGNNSIKARGCPRSVRDKLGGRPYDVIRESGKYTLRFFPQAAQLLGIDTARLSTEVGHA